MMPKYRGTSILSLLAAAAVTITLPAQVPAPQAPMQQPPTFRSATTVVEVDVIARDSKGAFVSDLGAEDFEVLEDGTPQEISAIYRVVGPGEPGLSAGAPDVPPPPARQVQRAIVFFFDQAHMEPGQFVRARNAARDFLARDFRQGDVGGVVNGTTMVNGRLTSVREELEAAVRATTPAPEAGTITREFRTWPRLADVAEAWRITRNEPGYNPGPTVLSDVTARACREQPDSCSSEAGRAMVEAQVQGKAAQLVGQARVLGKQTLNTISALSNGLARLPGRKTIVMLTGGFFVEDTWADLRQVVGQAARAAVRIYALDTRGLDRGSAGSDILSAVAPSQPELGAPTLGDTSADGPNSLAVDTGGYVIRNENDFGKAFSEIDRDTSSYYILGFRTARGADGRFHSLGVRVKRAGITVRARKGYVGAQQAAATVAPEVAQAPSPAPVPPAPSAPAATSNPAPGAGAGAPGAAADTVAASKSSGPETSGALRASPVVAEHVDSLRNGRGTKPRLPDAVAKAARTGWDAYQRGDLKTARSVLQPLATDSAAPPWAHYVLGWSEYASTEYAAATAAWERVRTAVAEFKPVYFDLADGYLQQKEFGKAIGVLREAERRWPADSEVCNALGVLQVARGALNDGIQSFEKAVAANPADATASYNLAKSLELRYSRQQRERRTSSSINPAGLLGDRDRAMEYYRRTIELGGPNADAAKEGVKRLGGNQ